VQTAAAWGLVFHVDPMGFLDRPAQDLPVMLAVLDVANARLRAVNEEA
jgi:hypothetical protein